MNASRPAPLQVWEGSLAIRIRDELGELFSDADFVGPE
ncbi:hypothetical protein SHJG_0786 [Streptomyces hygroscopicus subsp. jinggangensis 5008]|nr:hypothetical protein SHJG_0786 [Streptomyces hygroscopicus subsp. jinggangensis 5008]AGF60285.1 hypothetical protein SHJGH_0619 [Streptomyces hygroscopicus subsp. jinggangensis TL01]